MLSAFDDVVRGLLFVRYLLFGVCCCLLFVVCSLFDVCCLCCFFVVCCLLRVVCHCLYCLVGFAVCLPLLWFVVCWWFVVDVCIL